MPCCGIFEPMAKRVHIGVTMPKAASMRVEVKPALLRWARDRAGLAVIHRCHRGDARGPSDRRAGSSL
jgi:hypothetical protein